MQCVAFSIFWKFIKMTQIQKNIRHLLDFNSECFNIIKYFEKSINTQNFLICNKICRMLQNRDVAAPQATKPGFRSVYPEIRLSSGRISEAGALWSDPPTPPPPKATNANGCRTPAPAPHFAILSILYLFIFWQTSIYLVQPKSYSILVWQLHFCIYQGLTDYTVFMACR